MDLVYIDVEMLFKTVHKMSRTQRMRLVTNTLHDSKFYIDLSVEHDVVLPDNRFVEKTDNLHLQLTVPPIRVNCSGIDLIGPVHSESSLCRYSCDV